MLCSICRRDVQQIYNIKDSMETFTILFQANSKFPETTVNLCSWCIRLLNKVDKFRKMALEAQFFFVNGNFNPQDIYQLEMKTNIDQYNEIINFNVEVNNISEVYVKSDINEKCMLLEYNPISFDELEVKTEQDEGGDIFECDSNDKVENSLLSTKDQLKVNIFNNDEKIEKNQNIIESELIKFGSFCISRSALLDTLKDTDIYKCLLLTDNDILNENILKSETLKIENANCKCLLCLQTFENEQIMNEHFNIHSRKQKHILCKFCNVWINEDLKTAYTHLRSHYLRYKCKKCKYVSETEINVVKHYKNKHTDHVKKQLKCSFCGEIFNTKSSKQYHVDTVHKKIIHQCHECNKIFKSYTHLRIHKDIHKNEYFTCEMCRKTIKNRVSFLKHKRQHLREAHGEKKTDVSVFCEICNKRYKSRSTYRDHLERTSHHQSQREKYKCSQCDKTFLDKAYMREHQRLAHYGVGVDCEICGRKFSRKAILNKHLLTHGDKINFIQFESGVTCDICGTNVPTKSVLKIHLRSHEDKNDRPRDFVCEHCGKAFFTRLQMSEHVRIHSDERPLQCKKCSSTFKLKASLYMHNRLVHEKYKRNVKTNM